MPRSRPIFSEGFLKTYRKCDGQLRSMINKAIEKVLEKPELGKPLGHDMAGARSERIGSFRLVYGFGGDFVVFYKFEHRKNVYR